MYHLDLYRYWLAKRGGRPMPQRSDINPTEIPALLPYIGIIEKADGELRYRLIGTSMAEQLGFDATGAAVGSYVPAGQGVTQHCRTRLHGRMPRLQHRQIRVRAWHRGLQLRGCCCRCW